VWWATLVGVINEGKDRGAWTAHAKAVSVMLHVLPVELSLVVLSYLPLSTLCPLHSVSRKWFNFFSQNQSTIFRNAAILHGYTHPATLLLEDALSMHKGDPWEGATDWKDFCKLHVAMPFQHPFRVLVS